LNFSLHDSGAFAILRALSGDGRLGGYAVNRLLISIIVLLGFCVANAVDLGYSPDGGLVSFGEFDYVLNLYAYCGNDAVGWIDPYGENRYITQFDILNLGKSGGTQIHVGVAVDRWRCIKGRWVRSGISTFDFRPKQTVLNLIKSIAAGDGVIEESEGLHVKAPVTIKSTPEQDKKMLNMIRREMANPPFYNPIFHNCIFWSVGAVNYGMQKNK
jgi:hypothetical protein